MAFQAFVTAGTTGLAVLAGAAVANYNFQEEKKMYEEEKREWR